MKSISQSAAEITSEEVDVIPELELAIQPTEADIQDLTAKVNEAHKKVKSSGRDMFLAAIEAGESLRVIKDAEWMKHGDFMKFVEENCDFSHRTGTLYMSLAYREALRHGKLATSANLDFEEMGLAKADRRLRLLEDQVGEIAADMFEAIGRIGYPKLSPGEFLFGFESIEMSTVSDAISWLQELEALIAAAKSPEPAPSTE